MEITPYLPNTKIGFPPTVPLVVITRAIFYKLKIVVQWYQLSVKVMFEDNPLTGNAIYYNYGKWGLSDTLTEFWISFIRVQKQELNFFSIDLYVSHIAAMRGGTNVKYHGKKKRKTTNALCLNDRQGVTLAMIETIAGIHNDLYNIEIKFEVVTAILEQSVISIDGLFRNADAVLDSENFIESSNKKEINANMCFNKRSANLYKDIYFDQKLYDERFSV